MKLFEYRLNLGWSIKYILNSYHEKFSTLKKRYDIKDIDALSPGSDNLRISTDIIGSS